MNHDYWILGGCVGGVIILTISLLMRLSQKNYHAEELAASINAHLENYAEEILRGLSYWCTLKHLTVHKGSPEMLATGQRITIRILGKGSNIEPIVRIDLDWHYQADPEIALELSLSNGVDRVQNVPLKDYLDVLPLITERFGDAKTVIAK